MKIIAIIFVLLLIVIALGLLIKYPKKESRSEKCSSSCGALDDVNDPEYNIKEVITNTLLLEQHLAEKRKYCKQCIVKHFNISIGLLQETFGLCGCRVANYPKLQESLDLYKNLFKRWHADMDSDEVRLDVLEKLRIWRREMVDIYYFSMS